MTRSTCEPGWPALLTALLERRDLSADETAWAMDETMRGTATPARMAAFLVALRAKGETVEEIGGLVRSLTAHAHTVDVPGPQGFVEHHRAVLLQVRQPGIELRHFLVEGAGLVVFHFRPSRQHVTPPEK
ncbi:Anthranilate phosphoribosyltransferase [Streptomyces sp. enrichment culture]